MTRPTWSVAREPSRPFGGFRRPAPLALAAEPAEEFPEVADDAPRFVAGERVRHRRFGSGTIQAVQVKAIADGGAYTSVGPLSILLPGANLGVPLRVPGVVWEVVRPGQGAFP